MCIGPVYSASALCDLTKGRSTCKVGSGDHCSKETEQERKSYEPEWQPLECLCREEWRVLSQSRLDGISIADQRDPEQSYSEIGAGNNPARRSTCWYLRSIHQIRSSLECMFDTDSVDERRDNE